MAIYAVIQFGHFGSDAEVKIDAEMNYDTGDFYVGYVENCFDPYKVAVRAESFESAYEWLLTEPHIEEAIKVETDDELEDYGDNPFDVLTLNDNNVWCDTESVMLFKPKAFKVRFDK
jgi:hypothetical protein